MMLVPPKEIKNKIKFNKSEVFIRDGAILTSIEKEKFNQFKLEWKIAYEDRFK